MHRVADKATDCARARRIFLCDFGEREKKTESGACRRPEPSAAESDCTKPARACGAPSETSARLERLVTADGFLGQMQKICARKNTQAHQPTAAT